MNVQILPKEGRRDVLIITVEDETWKEVHTTIFGRKCDFFKKCCTLQELESCFFENEYRLAKNYALRSLARRGQLSTVLANSLKFYLVSTTTSSRIIKEFFEAGWLNDEEWIDSFIRLQLSKKVGPQAIKMKLTAKGIAEEVIGLMLQKWDGVSSQKEQIEYLLKTRYRRRNLLDFLERQKVMASLMRKGYDLSIIKTTVEEFSLIAE